MRKRNNIMGKVNTSLPRFHPDNPLTPRLSHEEMELIQKRDHKLSAEIELESLQLLLSDLCAAKGNCDKMDDAIRAMADQSVDMHIRLYGYVTNREELLEGTGL